MKFRNLSTSFLLACAFVALLGGVGCANDSPPCSGPGCDGRNDSCDGDDCSHQGRLAGFPAGARACEVLLEGESDVAMEVEFGQGVRGNHVAEGARVGLAFFVENGGILGKGAVTVNLSAPNRKPRAPALSRAACFDVDGEEIADVQLTFDH